MKKIFPVFLIYSILLTIVCITYLSLVRGPSNGIMVGLTVMFWILAIKSYFEKDKEDINYREIYTWIAAYSPGIIGFFKIYPYTKKLTDLFLNILLFVGFFGSIAAIGFMGFTDTIQKMGSGIGLVVLIVSAVSILFSFDISVTYTNGFCDKLNLPYGEGRFEIEHPMAERDAFFSFTIWLTIVCIVLWIYSTGALDNL